MSIADDHRQALAVNHAFVGAGTSRDKDAFQRNVPLVGEIAQGKTFGSAHWDDIQELAKGEKCVDRQVGLAQQAVDFIGARCSLRVDVVTDLERALITFQLQFETGNFRQHAAYLLPIPHVVDVFSPCLIYRELGSIMDIRAHAGYQHIGLRDAVARHDAQR